KLYQVYPISQGYSTVLLLNRTDKVIIPTAATVVTAQLPLPVAVNPAAPFPFLATSGAPFSIPIMPLNAANVQQAAATILLQAALLSGADMFTESIRASNLDDNDAQLPPVQSMSIQNIITKHATGTDLPDDDYRTLMPPPKKINVNTRNSSAIPIIIENKENDSGRKRSEYGHRNEYPFDVFTQKFLGQTLNQKNLNQRKTTITAITRRSSTVDNDPVDQVQSAPASPTLQHHAKSRISHNHISLDPPDSDTKSASSDGSALAINGPVNSLSWGTLEVRLKLDAKNNRMWVFVIKATLEMTQNPSKQTLVQVHLTVLPSKRVRYRTRVKPIDNAMFAEEFFCKVSPETIQNQGIRFRLYSYERFKREKLLAEASVMFAMVNLDEDMCKIIPLERAFPSQDSDIGSRSHASSASQSRQNSFIRNGDSSTSSLVPELEIGLAYDRNQAMLILEIGKGINFDMNAHGRAPDTCVQITLRNASGEDITTNQTVIRHTQHHPVFAERYPFNIQENFLEQITIVIVVLSKKVLNSFDQDFGSISFGHNTSGPAQSSHWEAMLAGKGDTITRWHTLIEK
ncbi:unnamed protein product, partial [Adineta ricciae]